MKITDHYIRKLPEGLRKELFGYVPRYTLRDMEVERFWAVMRSYGREDLAEKALGEMFPKGGSERWRMLEFPKWETRRNNRL